MFLIPVVEEYIKEPYSTVTLFKREVVFTQPFHLHSGIYLNSCASMLDHFNSPIQE